ncbi:MAG: hypothetical protein ACE5D8_05820 [Fidelibacterota bacterium]
MNRNQTIMSVILVILIIYWIIDSGILFPNEDKILSQEIAKLTEQTDVVDDARIYAALTVIPEIEMDAKWEGDPFFYSTPTEDTEGGNILGRVLGVTGAGDRITFDLNGISWLGNSGYALINERIVSEGDVINGYTVAEIAMNYVTLTQGLKTVRLTLDE